MMELPAQTSAFAFDLAIPAWSAFLLGIALVVALSNRRHPSIFVDLFILALVGAHAVQILIVNYMPELYRSYVLLFAFVPARHIADITQGWAPGGWLAYLWTPFTYALLHLNGPHIFGNGLGLFVFGRTVAWRIGGLGFLSLFAVACAAGAIIHLVFNWGSPVPLIGASAGAFGILGATFRFVPGSDDRLKALFWPDARLRQLPLASLREMVTEGRSLVYILICFIIYPLGLISLLAGTTGNTAVMAHVGGFACGVLGIGYFDRRRREGQPQPPFDAEGERETETKGLKLLRIFAVFMMIVGIILGVLGYYVPAFLP